MLEDEEIFEAHIAGKLSVQLRSPLDTQRALSIAYTPGVAQVSRAIAADHTLAARYTWANRLVAVVSDGSAVLGLGDIGPAAALPVMEGKSALFKAFADLDSIPIVLDTKDPDEIVETLVRLRPTFGAVNLEDIAAPRCFEIERRLVEALDCPVMHDDQHGTAIVVLAALIGATKVLGRDMQSLRMVISGVGAAGVACANILMSVGISHVTVLDSQGILHPGRDGLTPVKADLAQRTNPEGLTGGMIEALKGADAFLGVSAGVVPEELIASMAPDGIVFALSNPDPEVHPGCRRPARGDCRHRAKRFPEPDQQRAGVPRSFPRCAGRRCPQDHREDEDRRGRGDRLRRRRRLGAGPDRPEPAGPAGCAGGCCRRGCRRRSRGVTTGRLTALALAAALAMTACAHSTQHRSGELVVGSRPGAESVLLADIYTGALRSYGFPARTELAPDPLTKLDAGAFVVVPGFTGRVLQLFQPGTTVRSDAQVYKAMVGALPEGIAAGDYTTAAEDKPALAVTEATAKSWGGTDLSAVPHHCDGLVIGSIAGASTPSAVGSCRLPAAREFSADATLFAALRDGTVDRGVDHHHRPRCAGRPGGAHRRQAGAGAGRERGAAVPPQRAERSAAAGGQRGGGRVGHRRAG